MTKCNPYDNAEVVELPEVESYSDLSVRQAEEIIKLWESTGDVTIVFGDGVKHTFEVQPERYLIEPRSVRLARSKLQEHRIKEARHQRTPAGAWKQPQSGKHDHTKYNPWTGDRIQIKGEDLMGMNPPKPPTPPEPPAPRNVPEIKSGTWCEHDDVNPLKVGILNTLRCNFFGHAIGSEVDTIDMNVIERKLVKEYFGKDIGEQKPQGKDIKFKYVCARCGTHVDESIAAEVKLRRKLDKIKRVSAMSKGKSDGSTPNEGV